MTPDSRPSEAPLRTRATSGRCGCPRSGPLGPEAGPVFWTGALFWCKILRHGWLSALCRRGAGEPSGELAREGGGAGERTFGRPGLL